MGPAGLPARRHRRPRDSRGVAPPGQYAQWGLPACRPGATGAPGVPGGALPRANTAHRAHGRRLGFPGRGRRWRNMPIRGASARAGGTLGRDTELGHIEAWLAPGTAPGPVAPRLVLVIEGEPGIGKTTLWTEATGRARAVGWQVLSCRPAASDAGLSHVALADLLRGVPDDAFARLPAPQRRALGVALLREEAGGIDLDPRAVGTGLTALLGLIGSDGPLILAVDDAQWLDPASARALGFALRRLDDKQLRLVTTVRTEGTAGQRTGAFASVEASLDRQAITRIEVGPLSVAAIHQMFARTLGSSFARPMLVRIHRAAGGNPFYALEIGREVQHLGVPPPSRPLPIP